MLPLRRPHLAPPCPFLSHSFVHQSPDLFLNRLIHLSLLRGHQVRRAASSLRVPAAKTSYQLVIHASDESGDDVAPIDE